jgi:hypothetical protein
MHVYAHTDIRLHACRCATVHPRRLIWILIGRIRGLADCAGRLSKTLKECVYPHTDARLRALRCTFTRISLCHCASEATNLSASVANRHGRSYHQDMSSFGPPDDSYVHAGLEAAVHYARCTKDLVDKPVEIARSSPEPASELPRSPSLPADSMWAPVEETASRIDQQAAHISAMLHRRSIANTVENAQRLGVPVPPDIVDIWRSMPTVDGEDSGP